MSESPDRTEVVAGDVRLSARFAYAADTGAVTVDYRLDNRGAGDLAVFDRGDRHALLTGNAATGAVGVPAFVQDAPGAVTLQHLARPLPTPSPTLPPTPLAAKLGAGGSLQGRFAFAPPTEQDLRRVRWCVGVVPFDADAFTQPETVDGVEVWQGGFDLAARQRPICTPWFDVGSGRFADG